MVTENLKPILLAFVVLLIGAVFISEVADNVVDVTGITIVTNETFVPVNGSGVPLTNNQLVAFNRIANESGAFDTGNFTVNLQQGEVTWIAGPLAGVYQTSYTYRKVGDGASRTIVNITILLFAIGILGGFLAAISPSFRDFMTEKFRK